MGPSGSSWNGTTRAGCRRRLLRKGLEFHVLTINKSVHMKKVWKLIVWSLYICVCVLSLYLNDSFLIIYIYIYTITDIVHTLFTNMAYYIANIYIYIYIKRRKNIRH